MTTEITIEPKPVRMDNGWGVFILRSFGSNVTRTVGKANKTVWATLDTSPDNPVLVAIPQHPGAGPQPENTLTMIGVQDMVAEVTRSLEQVLQDIYTEKEEPKQESW